MKKQKLYKITDILPDYNPKDLTWVQEDLRIENNISIIDEKLEELSESLDRELTIYEEERILEIVDEYTPKDKDGNYLTDLLPFDYAWRIFKAKKESKWKEFYTSLM